MSRYVALQETVLSGIPGLRVVELGDGQPPEVIRTYGDGVGDMWRAAVSWGKLRELRVVRRVEREKAA